LDRSGWIPAVRRIAGLFARILALRYEGSVSHFAPARVNDTLVLDFGTRAVLEPHHQAFKVSALEFGAILGAGVGTSMPG
jgi:hypothetical protein